MVTSPSAELIRRVEWSSGGLSFGPAESLMWATRRPGPKERDLVSILSVHGSPDMYSEEELEKLADFGDIITEAYDRMWRVRSGANLVIIGKTENPNRWIRKRLTWNTGPMYSPSLEKAIGFMACALRLNPTVKALDR